MAAHGVAVGAMMGAVSLRPWTTEVDEGASAVFGCAAVDAMHPAVGQVLGCRGAGRSGQGGSESGIGIAVMQMPTAAVVVGDRRTDGETVEQLVEREDAIGLGFGIDDPSPSLEENTYLGHIAVGGGALSGHP